MILFFPFYPCQRHYSLDMHSLGTMRLGLVQISGSFLHEHIKMITVSKLVKTLVWLILFWNVIRHWLPTLPMMTYLCLCASYVKGCFLPALTAPGDSYIRSLVLLNVWMTAHHCCIKEGTVKGSAVPGASPLSVSCFGGVHTKKWCHRGVVQSLTLMIFTRED